MQSNPLRHEMPISASSPALGRMAGRWLLATLLFVMAAWIGRAWPLSPGEASVAWPATGMAIAVLVRWGLNMWPAIGVGTVAALVLMPVPWWTRALIAATHTGTVCIAAYLLSRARMNSALSRRRDANLFGLVAIMGLSIVAGSAEYLWLAQIQTVPPMKPLQSWLACCVSQATGAAFVAPILLSWQTDAVEALFHRARRTSIDIGLVLGITLLSAWVMLGAVSQALAPVGLALTPVLLALLAVRGGVPWVSLACMAVVLCSISGTWQGTSPLLQEDTDSTLYALWAYLGVLTLPALAVPALLAEVRANGERWHLALSDSVIGLGDWHLRTGHLYLSPRLKEMLGYGPDELSESYHEWRSRLHPDDVPRLEHQLRQHIAGDIPFIRAEHRLQCKDGTWKWFMAHGRIVTQSLSGKPLRLVGFAIDITEHRVVADRLRLSANLFEHLHEGLIITDVDYRIVDVNRAYERLCGRPRDELKGELPELLRPDIQNTETLSDLWACIRAQGAWRGEATGLRGDGVSYPQQVTMSVVRDEGSLITHHVLVVSDITQSRLARQQLEFQAHYDPLTQLPNRLRLLQLMRKAIAAVDRDRKHLLAVCYLDMDHFKPINDRFGHGVGDQLLSTLAARMRGAMRGGDAVARMGGDEFALLLRVQTKEECAMAVDRVLKIVTQPYDLEGHGPWTLTASIGVTIYPFDHANSDTLLRHADHAMYGAKQGGRNQIQFFDAEDDRLVVQRNEALRRLEEAINAGELLLHYQPKVNLRTGEPLGVEALLRWQHPQRGLIPPGEFLPLSDSPEMHVHLGHWVLGQAIQQLAAWRHQGLGLAVSVNIAGAHLQHPGFAAQLSSLLTSAGLKNGFGLELEVLEHSAFDDVDLTAHIMEQCRALGVCFALDDFGTGYSTLTYLKRLPVEVLKIDRSFVRSMLTDTQDLAIVEGVIGLSHTFRCSVVAEGVESVGHAEKLVSLGCEIGQGFGIANPMPPGEILNWLNARDTKKFLASVSEQPALF